MTTVVNNPTPGDSGSSMGMVVGILLVVGFIFVFFVYGLPALRTTGGGTNTGNSVPVPAVAIPDTIDVNIQPAKE